ncbi:MAG: tRNA (N6-isopentenyl adenosine(37)-C2)-methylthiotransferase MiaB [Patescibacteria group bacterium]
MARTFHIITFGCQMNHADSERIGAILLNSGLKKSKTSKSADVVIINSCSVRQMAEDRTYGKITELAKSKKRPRIVATGCLVSDKIWKKLLGKGRFDICLPIDRMIDLPKYLFEWKMINELPKDKYDHYLQVIPQNTNSFSAYLPIMTGCNNFCSYCAVPYTRGREVSRPKTDIIAEAEQLAKDGCVELTLLGQNVNSYGNDWHEGKNENDFVDLLRQISDIAELKRIYFISSHPKDMSDELIKLVGERANLCNYIHLPIQAGSNEIIRKMNRKYTREDYLVLVDKIKKWIPDVTITTDLIVGFPGETREQFAESVDIFERVQFDMAFIAQYSPRPKTAASKLEDDVSQAEKKKRKYWLNEVLGKIILAKNKKLVGQIIDVLVHKYQRGRLVAYTEGLKPVHLEGKKELIGKLIPVKITKAMDWGLEGEIRKN